MEFRRIGPLRVSAVGLGCNNLGRRLDLEASRAVVQAALDAGINFFDTADRYGYGERLFSGYGQSEVFLGESLRHHRDEVVIATKFGMPMSDDDPAMRGAGRSWVQRACEGSLKRLDVDHIDLYQLHAPDPQTPIAETLGALGELVEQGKVRVVGCSNFGAAELAEADATARAAELVRFQSVQNEYSLLVREAETDVLPLCAEAGLSFLPYFPLASGLLTGKYRLGVEAPADSRLASWTPRTHLRPSDDLLRRVEDLMSFAEEAGRSILELAFSWLLSRPQVPSVIAGATSPDQVADNVAAAGWQLSRRELAKVDSL